MEVSGIQIFANREARTGLSLLSGWPVESIADLPPWLVEIHLFRGSAGAEADLEEREIASKCDGPDGLAEAAALVARGYDAARKAMEAALREAFVAATKMTASRRRFIEAGEKDGVRLILHRGACKLRAGGLEIGATEAGIMERMGWIVRGRDGYAVTTEGIEAARAVAPKRAARA